MKEVVAVLEGSESLVVVKVLGRTFPGVILQGDTLFSIFQEVSLMRKSLLEGDVDEVKGLIESVSEYLVSMMVAYEKVCLKNDISLPYAR